jgi:hypothetical protein
MQFKAFLYFTLLGSSIAQSLSSQSHYARELHPRDVRTLVTIKSSLKHGTEGVIAVGNALKAVTAANAKGQLKTVNSALMKLSSDVSSDTRKMKSSGTIGIGEVLGLLQEGPRNELLGDITGLFSALNSTAFIVGDKREIIKNSGTVDIVVPGIKAQKQGLLNIMSIVPSQVPAIAKGPINSIINSLFNGASKGSSPTRRSPATPPELLRRQTLGKGKSGTGKGSTGKGSTGKGSSSTSSGATVTIDTLFASAESLEATGKFIDSTLDQIIAWLRGTTEDLIPPEVLAGLANAAASMQKGAPKGATPS